MMSASTWPGPTRRKLIHIAHQQQRRLGRQRLEHRMHQRDVHHGGLIKHQEVRLQRMLLPAPEAAALGVGLQQAMDRPRLEAGGLRQPLGRPSSRRREQHPHSLRRQDAQDRLDDRRLAHPRPAGDHKQLRAQRQRHRGALALGQRKPDPRLHPGDRALRIDLPPGRAACGEGAQPGGDAALGRMQTREDDAARRPHHVGHHRPFAEFERERLRDELRANIEQLGRKPTQLLLRQAAMPLLHRLGERVADASPDPDHRRRRDAEPHRDRIRRLEADAADVAGQPVGVLRHDLHGIGAIGLEDPHRPRGADPMAVQEHHDLAHHLLLSPGAHNPLGAHRPDARHLAQPLGRSLDHVEDSFAEGRDQFPGIDRADAADQAGGEIFLDALRGGRRGGAQEARLELRPVLTIMDPGARRRQPFAGRNARRMPDDGHEVTMPAGLYAQHAEAVLGIVEGHALDGPGEHVRGGRADGRLGNSGNGGVAHAHRDTRPPSPRGTGITGLAAGGASDGGLCARTGA
jgi:hypothetical protein